jgi:signal transduction histidine kinase
MLSLAEKATMCGVLTARTVKERLVEQLASDAAESEHRHTAFGLHEGVIPPYIALQIGLTAVRQKLGRGQAASSGRSIDSLISLKDERNQLRHMIQPLRNGGAAVGRLLASIRRFAVKFAEATGIQVQIEATQEPPVNDRLAAGLCHLVAEGLSSVRRHTPAHTAAIQWAQGIWRPLQIARDSMAGEPFVAFMPRSMPSAA